MRPIRTFIKDPFPGLSHLFGAVLAVAALIVLLHLSAGRTSWTVAFAIYGASLISLYLASGLCHSIYCKPYIEKWLDRCDYMAIFLLIAGTYTPICMIALRSSALGWTILAIEWLLAASGIGYVLFGKHMSNTVRAILYVSMGWLAVIAAIPIWQHLPHAGLAWLLAGGALYSVGAIVFVTDRPHLVPGWFRAHDLWHCMVIGGSTCHFLLMLSMIAR